MRKCNCSPRASSPGAALAVGREKEGELATSSLEFEYLHQKSRCEMLIGGDDISNDTCFSMFVYIRARFVSVSPWLAEIWQLSRRGATGELEVEFKFQRISCKCFLLFPSSETQGQSVGSGEEAWRKFSGTGERAPGYRLSPSYFQNFKRMPAPHWAQKMLCNIVLNRRTVNFSFFCFRYRNTSTCNNTKS